MVLFGVCDHHGFERIEGDRGNPQFGLDLLAVGNVRPLVRKPVKNAFGVGDRNPGNG